MFLCTNPLIHSSNSNYLLYKQLPAITCAWCPMYGLKSRKHFQYIPPLVCVVPSTVNQTFVSNSYHQSCCYYWLTLLVRCSKVVLSTYVFPVHTTRVTAIMDWHYLFQSWRCRSLSLTGAQSWVSGWEVGCTRCGTAQLVTACWTQHSRPPGECLTVTTPYDERWRIVCVKELSRKWSGYCTI